MNITVDPLTQAIERVRRDLDRSIPIKENETAFLSKHSFVNLALGFANRSQSSNSDIASI